MSNGPLLICSDCGVDIEVSLDEDGRLSFNGHFQHFAHSVVRCYKCPPKVGPIKCDSGPVEAPEPLKPGVTRIELGRIELDEPKPITMDDCLEGAEEIRKHDEIIRKNQEALQDPVFLGECKKLRDEHPAKGCTCGAWVTKETHADHCALAK